MGLLTDEPTIPRDALSPLGNGKLVALGRWVLSTVVTVLVAYYSAQIAIEQRITRVETRQESNFQEVLRTLDRVEAELIRLRGVK
jgi:hypothetical protein